ncbi:26S proteasome subunit RPN7-domain-containing protein [Infundibulicybe gibba]|nr:26S proteasome subunit RPN7-domain-containing protein [Infundibulicybe gibba]
MTDDVFPIPNLELPQHLFTFTSPTFAYLHDNASKEFIKGVQADNMAPYYRAVASLQSGIVLDQKMFEAMEKENGKELTKLDDRLAEADKTEGESEISDALKARANYLTCIGDKERSVGAQNLALEKTPGLGSRIDVVLTLGDDWDRRNRLKVYNRLHLLSIRQFKWGGELFTDALSTFTTSELIPYDDFVALTVIANTLTLKRVDLKKKIISAPEVNQVLPELPIPGDLVKNLYELSSRQILPTLEQTHLLPSRILSPYTRYYVRKLHILAYTQLLESYRSLTLESLWRGR